MCNYVCRRDLNGSFSSGKKQYGAECVLFFLFSCFSFLSPPQRPELQQIAGARRRSVFQTTTFDRSVSTTCDTFHKHASSSFPKQFNYIFILSSHTQKTESQRTGLDTGSGPLRLQHHVARSVSKKKRSPNFGERFLWPLLRVGARLAANPLPKLSLLVKSGSSPVIPSGEQLF